MVSFNTKEITELALKFSSSNGGTLEEPAGKSKEIVA